MKPILTIFVLLFVLAQQYLPAQTITEFIHKRDSLHKIDPAFEHSLIKLGGGLSYPKGVYAEVSSFDVEEGFAQKGYFGEVAYTWLFFRNVGLGISGFAAEHSVNDSAVEELYDVESPDTEFDISATPYVYRSIMGHLFFTFGSDFFHLDAKLMAGYGFLQVSDIEGTIYTDGSAVAFTQEGGESTEINMGAEVTLRFRIVNHLFLELNESYLAGNFYAENAYVYTYDIPWEYEYDRTPRFLRIANTGLSLTYSF